MQKLLLATAALAGLATPAFAAADGPYVGIEGGVVLPHKNKFDVTLDNNSANPVTSTEFNNGLQTKYKTGWGVDAIAGYKLGIARLEAELGYQRASVKSARASDDLLDEISDASGTVVTNGDIADSGHIGVTTLMANALLDQDFGQSRFGGYIGGGVGNAWARFAGDKDNAIAVQGIAGVRYAVTPNIDAGIKYRYLHTGKLKFDDDFTIDGTNFETTSKDNFNSHSILASLVYNFNSREAAPAPIPAAAPVVAPPPPEAPATQTCADGSVILATSACPAPPPPPPAPTERGERGR